MLRKNTAANFVKLLGQGQYVDWQYSLVMVLVIGGLICTPLILGSIRDRAYQVHKREVETTNNAREIRIHSAGERAKTRFDEALVERIGSAEPEAKTIGTFKVPITPKGPNSTYLVGNAMALAPDDPRIDVFDIQKSFDRPLALREVIVSDALGALLYGGEEAWNDAWTDGHFTGEPLRLIYADSELTGHFEIVGRQRRPGRALFFSPELGSEMRRSSLGLGSPILGLPAVAELVTLSLPKLRSTACLLTLPPTAQCSHSDRDNLMRDLSSRQHSVEQNSPISALLPRDDSVAMLIHLMQQQSPQSGRMISTPLLARCDEILGPMIANRCSSASAIEQVSVGISISAFPGDEAAKSVELFGITPALFELMRSQLDLEAQAGPLIVPNSLEQDGRLIVLAPSNLGLKLQQEFEILAGSTILPARIGALYRCDTDCRLFSDLESTFRVSNLAADLIEPVRSDPLLFRPKRSAVEYDEILVYARSMEAAPELAARLRDLLGSDYSVEPNTIAIELVKRDNARLSAVFLVTLAFAIVFLLLSLSALSKINIARRSRQMAQLLILGFSRGFVRSLVISEYLLITALSAGFAFLVSTALCFLLRAAISSGYFGDMPTDASFQRVINAMEIDPGMFWQVSAYVLACAVTVAAFVAQIASRSDPIELLE